MPLYTWGYAGSTPEDLAALIRILDIDKVIDCRSAPVTRVPGFGRRQLEKRFMTKYIWRGDVLGGRTPGVTQDGLNIVRHLVDAQANVLAMCMEREPRDCHRHRTIGLPLAREGMSVHHVYRDSPRAAYEVILATELQRAIDDDDDYTFVKIDGHLKAKGRR